MVLLSETGVILAVYGEVRGHVIIDSIVNNGEKARVSFCPDCLSLCFCFFVFYETFLTWLYEHYNFRKQKTRCINKQTVL